MEDSQIAKQSDALFAKVAELIEQARRRVVTAVNVAEVYTRYHIGQYIIEDEQQGKKRAQYGKQVLNALSARLTERFGSGWSIHWRNVGNYLSSIQIPPHCSGILQARFPPHRSGICLQCRRNQIKMVYRVDKIGITQNRNLVCRGIIIKYLCASQTPMNAVSMKLKPNGRIGVCGS